MGEPSGFYSLTAFFLGLNLVNSLGCKATGTSLGNLRLNSPWKMRCFLIGLYLCSYALIVVVVRSLSGLALPIILLVVWGIAFLYLEQRIQAQFSIIFVFFFIGSFAVFALGSDGDGYSKLCQQIRVLEFSSARNLEVNKEVFAAFATQIRGEYNIWYSLMGAGVAAGVASMAILLGAGFKDAISYTSENIYPRMFQIVIGWLNITLIIYWVRISKLIILESLLRERYISYLCGTWPS